MSSSAALTVTSKSFGKNGVPENPDVTAKATLKKKVKGTTLSLSLTDASLRDSGKSLKDVVVTAERKLSDNVKGSVLYDLGAKAATGSLTVDKDVNGSTLTLKATYKQKGDAFILDETWKFNKSSKVAGSYNFRSEEAIATYTYSKDGWTASGSYNFSKEEPKLSLSRKQGKHTVEGVYEVKKKAATLTWSVKPLKAQLKASVDGGFKAQQASLMLTQEFDL